MVGGTRKHAGSPRLVDELPVGNGGQFSGNAKWEWWTEFLGGGKLSSTIFLLKLGPFDNFPSYN